MCSILLFINLCKIIRMKERKREKLLLHIMLEDIILLRNTINFVESQGSRFEKAILLRGSLIQPNCPLMRILEIFMKFYENFSSCKRCSFEETPEGYEDFNFEQRLCRYQRYSHCCLRLRTNQIYSTCCRTSIKHSQTTSL